MKKLEFHNNSIAYTDQGSGNMTLLFLHGSFIDRHYWDAQVRYFCPHYRVIAPDFPGHGDSGRNYDHITAKNLGTLVPAIVEDLQLEDVVIIGHSLGADVMLEAVSNSSKNIAGLIAVDYFRTAGQGMPPEAQAQVDQVLKGLQTDFPKTAETFARTGMLGKNTPVVVADCVVKDYRNMDPTMGRESVNDLFQYPKRQGELMKKLTLKLHVINTNYKPTNETLLREYAGAGYSLTIIEGTSHFPMIESPMVLNHALENAIADIAKSFKSRRLEVSAR